jgi:hypothetical protein
LWRSEAKKKNQKAACLREAIAGLTEPVSGLQVHLLQKLITKMEQQTELSTKKKGQSSKLPPEIVWCGGRNRTYLATLCKLYHFSKEKGKIPPKLNSIGIFQ